MVQAASGEWVEATDGALAKLAAVGREDALEQIMRRHNRQLFRAARAVLRNDADAEDAVQEAYVRAFTRLSTFRGDAALQTNRHQRGA